MNTPQNTSDPGWIDISVSLHNGLVSWPNNDPVNVVRDKTLASGYHCNLSVMSMSVHSGTHMDAPVHFIDGAPGLDTIPPDATIGPARVIGIDHPELVTADELARHEISAGDRILLKTRNSERNWPEQPFLRDAVYITTEAGEFLAERRVRTIGIDYLSVGGYEKNGVAVHRALLEAEIWIIEGLYLRDVEPGEYELVCLPLKIQDSDGAPARAVIRPRR